MNAPDMSPLSPEGVPTETVRNNARRRVVILPLIALVCGGLLMCLIVAVRAAQANARCMMCENQLKMLGLGLQAFDSSNGGLPPAYLCDENGKPIHSWQSVVKPFLGYYTWRKTYSMKEPWNGPNNRKLISYPDDLLKCPDAGNRSGPTIDYVAVVGPDTMWPGRERVKLPSEDDGDRETILLIEMPDSAYGSLEPRSPTVEEFLEIVKSPTGKGIRCIHPKGLAYLTVGGDVRWFTPLTDPETIRRLFKRDPNCRVISLDEMTPLIEHWEDKGHDE
ncbi:MAG: DUF1559 family PulG-like putative transporter [Pirellulales bacterium]